jgi:hypothetical protein
MYSQKKALGTAVESHKSPPLSLWKVGKGFHLFINKDGNKYTIFFGGATARLRYGTACDIVKPSIGMHPYAGSSPMPA